VNYRGIRMGINVNEYRFFILSLLFFFKIYINFFLFLRYNLFMFCINYVNLYRFVLLLKMQNLCRISSLMDINVVELITNLRLNFQITYSFWSVIYKIRIFIRIFVKNFMALISIKSLFNSADWLEREIWDMFGIKFLLHGDLRRILTDYGFKGHPLRKTFPLTGYIEVRYDDTQQFTITEPVEFAQRFRFFKFNNPWRNWKI